MTACIVTAANANAHAHGNATATATRGAAATATATATRLVPSLGSRVLHALRRYFSRSVVTRDAVDQAWIDSGLGRLDRSTLEDMGAPALLVQQAQQRSEAWKLLAALDSTRLL